jgi:hypothetical protein
MDEMKYHEFEYGYEKDYKYLNKDNAINKAKELLIADIEKYKTKNISHNARYGEPIKVTEIKFKNTDIIVIDNEVQIIGTPEIRLVEKIEHITREIKEVGKPYSPEIKTVEDKILLDWQDAYNKYEGFWPDIKDNFCFIEHKGYCEHFKKMENTIIVRISIYSEEIKFEDEVK